MASFRLAFSCDFALLLSSTKLLYLSMESGKSNDVGSTTITTFENFFQGEMNLEEGAHFHDRPPLDIVIRKFRAAKITAYLAGLFFTALFVCVWPGSMLSVDVLSFAGFNAWTILSRAWALVAATFIIIVPLVQEVRSSSSKCNQR